MSLNNKIISPVLHSIILIIVFLFALSPSLQAQNCNRNSWEWMGHNNWFIPLWAPNDGKGYIIDQRANTISAVQQPNFTTGTKESTSIRGYQGIAAASDDNGKLIFFTNGRKVWKPDGTIISNSILQGNECGSVGDRGSAVHGCMIVRHPLQPNAYYIIAIDDIVNQGTVSKNNQGGTCGNGITFAVVDSSGNMIHDSEPIERDITSGHLGAFRTTEGFSATFHGNGVDIWLTFHPLWSDNYVSYLLTCDGFVTPPVSSGKAAWCEIAYANGDVDFSPDGKKLAVGAEIWSTGGHNEVKYNYGTLRVHDFDNWTGIISNPKYVSNNQWSFGGNIYNIKWDIAGKWVHFNGTSLEGKFDASSNNEATIRASLVRGPTGSLSKSFHGAAITYDGKIEQRNVTNARFAQIGTPDSKFGANDMYIPPLEEPDMGQIGPYCDTSASEDIHTYWRCAGTSSEDTVTQKHSYFLLDSNDLSGATHDPNSGTVVGEKTGIFDPVAAGPGTHKIVFQYCGVDDTMEVVVAKCPACKAKLKDVFPTMCAGNNLRLDTMIMVATGIRTWTIDSFPSNSGTNASLDITPSDTLFDALANDARWGIYKLKLEGTYNLDVCYDTMYVRVDSLPIPDLGVDTIVCTNWDSVTFDAGLYDAFDWGSDGGNAQTITKLESKIYSVEVTNSFGCKGTDDVELTVNPLPIADLGNDTAICAGDIAIIFNASVRSTGGNGVAITKYTWNDAANGATKSTDIAGEYWVAIEDANMCHDTDSVVLIVHDLPDVTLRSDTSICAGDDPVDFIAFGGITTDTTYTWSSGEVGEFISKDDAGMYKVVMEDQFGCLDSDSVELTINDLPIIELRDSTICQGAPAVVFDAEAATPGMTKYTWNDTDESGTFTTDVAGKYWVIVIDANQCSDTDSVTLTVNSFVPVEIGPDTAICADEPDVLFDAGIEGANSYVWAKEDLTPVGNDQTFLTGDAGKYYLALEDSNGCPGVDSIVLTVNVLPEVDLGPDTAICSGDPKVVFDAGNSGVGMKYSWNIAGETGQTYSTDLDDLYWVAIEDVNGCSDTDSVVITVNALPIVDLGDDLEICDVEDSVVIDAVNIGASYTWSTGESTQTISIHSNGTFTVNLVDTNGCLGSDDMELIVFPMPIVALRDTAICIGDVSITFDVGAGFDVYDWKSGESTQTLTTDQDGEYSVIFTDAQGCTGYDTVVLVVNPLPTPDLGDDQTICADASAVTFDPGTGYDVYAWTGGVSTPTLSTKIAGVYEVEVTDDKGCKQTDEVELIVIDMPTPDIIKDETKCPGSSHTFDVIGFDNGNGAFTYAWHDGSTNSTFQTSVEVSVWVDITDAYGCTGRDLGSVIDKGDLTVNILDGITVDLCEGEDVVLIPNYKTADGYFFTWTNASTGTAETLTANTTGTYDLHVDNGAGCEGAGTIDVIVHPLPVLSTSTAAICDGEAATIGNDLGGNYTYKWDTDETSAQIIVTTGGTYEQVVTSNKGCISSTTVNVTLNSNPTPDLGDDITVCEEVLVTLSDKSGQAGLTYVWSEGSTTNSISPTSSGTYTVTATTSVDCKGVDDVLVTFIGIPVVDLGDDITLCEGESTTIDAENDNLSVRWNTGQLTSEITVNATNEHIVTVDNGTCTANDTIQINVVSLPESNIDQTIGDQPYCFNELNGRPITVEAGPNSSYNYSWGTGATTSQITIESPGTYVVSITVGNCEISDNITINDFCPSTLYVPNTFTPDDNGLNDVFNVEGTYITDYKMLVFDRWGLLLYETEDINMGWDGTYMGNLVQIDTYVYKIYYSINDTDGTPIPKQKVGHVNVIR